MKKEKKLTNHISDVIAKKKEVPKEEIYIDGVHEYDYNKIEDDVLTIHTLYYSNWIEWVDGVKTTIALQIIDTGNGVVIQNLESTKEIDYLKLEQLHILLRLTSESKSFKKSEPSSKLDF
jgi:hypothetical protein